MPRSPERDPDAFAVAFRATYPDLLAFLRRRVEAGDVEDLAAEVMTRAWAHLSAADREALALVAWDGLTGQEAAAVLGCTRTAFSVRLTRARRRLRALLKTEVTAPASPPTTSPLPALAEGSRR